MFFAVFVCVCVGGGGFLSIDFINTYFHYYGGIWFVNHHFLHLPRQLTYLFGLIRLVDFIEYCILSLISMGSRYKASPSFGQFDFTQCKFMFVYKSVPPP